MPSSREPNSPVDTALGQLLSPYAADVQALALCLRSLVRAEAPHATELFYDAYNAVAIAFTFTDRLAEAFCHVAVYARHVNLGFNRGAELPDPKGLLQGSGKHIRHVKVRQLAEVEDAHLQAFIRIAVARARPMEGPEGKPLSRVQAVSARKRRPA